MPATRAGHADREAAVARLLGIGLARLVQEHVAKGVAARLLAIVDRDRLAALGVMDDHEAAAAEVAGARQGHGERERDGRRRVHGVAAVLQHLEADPGRGRLLGRDHAALAVDRVDQIAIAVDPGLLRQPRTGAAASRPATTLANALARQDLMLHLPWGSLPSHSCGASDCRPTFRASQTRARGARGWLERVAKRRRKGCPHARPSLSALPRR